VATGSYLLPIILSCVIYVVMICRKRKILRNKIEVVDEEIINSEHQIPGILLADFHKEEISKSVLRNPKEDFISIHFESSKITVGNQEHETKNTEYDCNSKTYQSKVREETKESNIEYISDGQAFDLNVANIQQEPDNVLTIVMNSLDRVESTLEDICVYDSIQINNTKPVEIDLGNVDKNLTPMQEMSINESEIIVADEKQFKNNLSNLPTVTEKQGVPQIRARQGNCN
jgi:hypothetical protein